MIDHSQLARIALELLENPPSPSIIPIRSTFYGTSLRIVSKPAGIDAHVKANPGNFANEAAILAHFEQAGLGARFPKLLASSPDGSIVATLTCGEPMRELFKARIASGEPRAPMLEQLADALSALVEAQAFSDASALIAAGAASFPSPLLPELAERLARDGLEDTLLSEADRADLSLLARRWLPWAEELSALGLSDAWDHGDFGSGNALLSSAPPARAILIDLSESAVMNPCFSASQFVWRAGQHLGIDPHGPEGARLRDHWAEQAARLFGKPKSALLQGFDLASKLYGFYGALISQRFAQAHRAHAGALFPNSGLLSVLSDFRKASPPFD